MELKVEDETVLIEELHTSQEEDVPHNSGTTDDDDDHDLIIKKKVKSVKHLQHYLEVFFAATAYCMQALFIRSISPIADVLAEEYNVSLSAIGLLSSSIFISGLIFALIFGLLLRLISYRKMLFIAWIGLILCFLLFALCESLEFGILLRVMAGMFGASTWLIIIGFGAQYFGNNSLSVISAFTICYTRSVTFVSITIQAFVYEKYQNWRGIYYIMALIGIITIIAYIITIVTSPAAATDSAPNEDDDSDNDTRVEKALQIQTKAPLRQLSRHERERALSSDTMDLQFDLHQNQKESNTTPKLQTKSAFTNYLNWMICIIMLGVYAIMNGILGLWFIPYLMIKFGFDRVAASITVGIAPWFNGFGALLIGYLAAKYKKRKIFLYFGITCMSSISIIVYFNDVPDFIIFAVMIMVGIGTGSFGCLLYTLSHEYNASNHSQDIAAGLITSMRIGAGFVSQYLIGILLDHNRSVIRNDHNQTHYKTDDYQFAFSIILPPCVIMTVIATFILKETNGKNL